MKQEQKQISAELEQDICKLIVLLASRSGKHKVTWKELEHETGFSRQALSNKPKIAETYKEVNGGSNVLENIEKRAEDLQTKVEKLSAENSRLKKLLADYDEVFVRWLNNATTHGMSVEQLEAPLPHSMKTKARLKDLRNK